jgi:hypothetical protein
MMRMRRVGVMMRRLGGGRELRRTRLFAVGGFVGAMMTMIGNKGLFEWAVDLPNMYMKIIYHGI